MSKWQAEINSLQSVIDSLQADASFPEEPPVDPVPDPDPPSEPTVGTIGTVVQEAVTPEQVALYAPIAGNLPQGVTARVEYALAGAGVWLDAMPLWRIQPQWSGSGSVQDAFAGVIYDLAIGATYNVRVTFDDGETQDVRELICHTRELPAERGETTIQVTTEAELQDAMHAVSPGDVIQIMNDITLETGALWSNQSGTEEQPIYVCGSGRDDVKLILPSAGKAFQPRQTDWWVWEDFTLQGPGLDGLESYSTAVQFWSGANPIGTCFRRLKIVGFDRGILGESAMESALVYDCVLEGNNPWDVGHAGLNITWNDDGIRLPGVGNCAFNNDLTGFGDSLALKGGIPNQRSIYFYRNKIRNSCDDAAELEYGTRNYAFYDNHVTNSGTGVSFDGVIGGPLYIFRNRFINNVRGILKCGAPTTGVLILANTFVAKGQNVGWYFSSARLRDWEYRNNMFLWEGVSEILWFDSGACFAALEQWKCDHNGWGRNGQPFHYVCNSVNGTLAEVHAAMSPIHDNDIDLTGQSSVFAVPVELGSDFLTEITDDYTLELSDVSEALAAGAILPNVSEHGDLGAIGFGESLPLIGNQHIPVVEPPVEPPVETPTGPLVDLAASLQPGESAAFDAGEVPDSMMTASDLAWQAHWHFDPTRNECSLLGDPPGAGEHNALSHARYDIATNEWTLIGKDIFFDMGGHVYANNADDAQGNIYFRPYNVAEVAYYNREANAWDLDSTIVPNMGFKAGPSTSVGGGGAFHPNVGEQGALIYMGRTRLYAWDKATNSWATLGEFKDTDFGGHLQGSAVYVPGLNKVVFGHTSLLSVDADLTVEVLGPPPLKPNGGSAASTNPPVSMLVHPSNDSMIVLIARRCGDPEQSTGKVYSSLNGIDWTYQGENNPFTDIGNQGCTICSIPSLGIFWAMGKYSAAGQSNSVVWKPDF